MNRNKFNVILLSLLLGLAPVSGQVAEFRNSVGGGIQFGGLIGWQGAIHSGRNRFRGAFGLSGFAWGYDRFLGPHYSVGAQIFGNQFRLGGGLSFNYYLSQLLEPGFVFGLDVYRALNSQEVFTEVFLDIVLLQLDGSGFDIDAEAENGAFVSNGYQF